MSLLLETIKLHNGKLFNLSFHNERMNRARIELFGETSIIDLEKILQVPIEKKAGLFKCRVTYNREISKIEWLEYVPQKIARVKTVECDEIDYSYKYADRKIFGLLKKKIDCRDNEEILIIKNGVVTDTSFSNVVFFDGKNWFTPSVPLLKGTQREKLLRDKLIVEGEIKAEQLKKFVSFKLINAMLEFDSTPSLQIQLIIRG